MSQVINLWNESMNVKLEPEYLVGFLNFYDLVKLETVFIRYEYNQNRNFISVYLKNSKDIYESILKEIEDLNNKNSKILMIYGKFRD